MTEIGPDVTEFTDAEWVLTMLAGVFIIARGGPLVTTKPIWMWTAIVWIGFCTGLYWIHGPRYD